MDSRYKNRETLKSYFRKGQVPTEEQFAALIDSLHNVSEDGCLTVSEDNGLSSRCEGVGVLLSVGGNTSAYLATERYRSMSIQPSACHSQYGLVPVGVPGIGTTVSSISHCAVVGSASDGSYSSLCSWVKGFDVIPPSAVFHPIRHGKVITDATLERRVSISPMFHCEESSSSEYCA